MFYAYKNKSLKIMLLLSTICVCLFGANEPNINQRESVNEQNIIKQAQSLSKHSDIKLEQWSDNDTKIPQLDLNESPCFEIDYIALDDKDSNEGYKFQNYLRSTLSDLGFKGGMCLGENSINAIISSFNNKIISAGYITTTANIKPVNLKSRRLEFELNLGTINSISINNDNNQRHRAMLFSAFGEIDHNKTLNIRNIEQALENISNATLGEVDVSLAPSKAINSTDIIITRKSRALPLSLFLGLDNAGSKETGRYQTSTALSAFNLLGFNESYAINVGKAVFNKEETRLNNENKKGGSHNHYINFSVPFGPYTVNYTNSRYSYDQIIAGANNLYKYSGVSRAQNLGLHYLFYRDQNLKSTVFINFFKRNSQNYIEEFELANQRRVTAGYELGVKSQLNINSSQLYGSLSYKRGTGMLGAQPAPEQSIGEGTSRMKIWLLDLGYKSRLNNNMTYDAHLHAQYNTSKLTLQDRLSIGGIYSIRGFDGRMSLVGQKGIYLRNTLSYNYVSNHALYFALDGGAVYDTTSQSYNSNKLAGAGIGIKGSFEPLGTNLNYDLLFSKPVYKPKYFETNKVHIGFRIGLGF